MAFDTYHNASNTVDYKMTGGVYGRQYWLDGSIGSTLGSEIYSAKWLWGNSTSLVAFAQTSTKASAEIEWYQAGSPTTYCGITNFYDNGNPTPESPVASNWDYNRIVLTSDLGDAAAGCGNYRGILVHEMGHALGLAHVVYPTVAVMRLDIASLTTAAPKADDVNGIDHLY